MQWIKKILRYFVAHKYVATIVLFLALIGYFDSNSLYNRYQLYCEGQLLQAEVDAYTDKYNCDTKLYNELMSDSNAVVRIAREKYFMKKANEDVYVFEDIEDEEAQ